MKSFKKNIFRTASEDPCVDCIAHDVTIGTQTLTGCNATITQYRNGDFIPEVTDPAIWATLTTGAWCYYDNAPANEVTYGKLYNWYAVNDPRGLAPVGYHIPTETEFNTLASTLGGSSVAGSSIKEVGLCHWNLPNSDATNSTGLSAVGAGYRNYFQGDFAQLGHTCNWWSSTETVDLTGGFIGRTDTNIPDFQIGPLDKRNGISVRFIKD